MGNIRFSAPTALLLWLRDTFLLETLVETGTNRAATAVWAADHFAKVITIEGFEPLYLEAKEKFSNRANITFLLGDSRTQLREQVPQLTAPAIFWLDAHWCGECTFGQADECPVLHELETLNESAFPHIILIDDARLFLAPPPAPHSAEHWPDIATICALLSKSSARYITVFEDVIIAIPASARAALVEFLRAQALSNAVAEQPQATPTVLQRVKRRLGRALSE